MKKQLIIIALVSLFVMFRPGPAQVPLGSSVIHWYLDAPVRQVSDDSYQLPEVPTQVMIFRNGMRVKDCVRATGECDYSVVYDRVNFTPNGIPVPGDVLIFDYIR